VVLASETFTRELVRGRSSDPDSVAWDFFQRGKIDDRAQPVPADAWFETEADVEIIEHSTASDEHATVLSMLWIPKRVAGPRGILPHSEQKRSYGAPGGAVSATSHAHVRR
jgi:hypothetical protein